MITTRSSWRWCFLFNVPCGVFAIIVMLATWPNRPSSPKSVVAVIETSDQQQQSPEKDDGRLTWSRVDFLGALLLIAATVLTTFALQEAGAGVFAWSSATIVGSLVGGWPASTLLPRRRWHSVEHKLYVFQVGNMGAGPRESKDSGRTACCGKDE